MIAQIKAWLKTMVRNFLILAGVLLAIVAYMDQAMFLYLLACLVVPLLGLALTVYGLWFMVSRSFRRSP